MRDFFVWMNETSRSIALRESFFVWPIVEASHVLTIMLFVGTIIMVDLRLLGVAFRDVSVSEMTARILPWTIAGFALLGITGALLFYAKPLVYYHSLFFRLKLVMLVLAMGNILWFHHRVQRDLDLWDRSPRIPGSAKTSAMISLTAWTVIVIAGRMIAYDWYNCEKLSPGGLLSTLASCPTAEVAQNIALMVGS